MKTTMEKLREVKQKVLDLNLDANSIGIGINCINVGFEETIPENLPKEIDGVDINYHVIGKIVLL